MLKLEQIQPQAQIAGLIPNDIVTIISAIPSSANALTVVYKTQDGNYRDMVLYRENEETLELVTNRLAWSFDAPGKEFKLALEAKRMELACRFDPMMAIHCSNIQPLPHQISAVYESMLPKQPLRFVLADDPGAGKTIMAGLLIKELQNRSDSHRILIVAPGSLVVQWQDEMREKFGLDFKIFSSESFDASPTGNFFADENRIIASIDKLARDSDRGYLTRLEATQWDLIIVDEAHKLSAQLYASKVNKTKRYELGELLSRITRHFLLMTATPHNGKEADFQLWLSLLDPDRFYPEKGTSQSVEPVDVSDVMRRMIKEELYKFDGTRLFPQRFASTINYKLTPSERLLYEDVTQYVVSEMNRADRLDGQRKGQVGFALTILQRRLASSPAAIYQSLSRRRIRLEKKLNQMTNQTADKSSQKNFWEEDVNHIAQQFSSTGNSEDVYEDAFDSMTGEQYEQAVDEILDRSTAARTREDLKKEIESLKELERQAKAVYESGQDCKWSKLSEVLQNSNEKKMRDEFGRLQKLIIFTEHRDTLEYLRSKIGGLLGNPNMVAVIHGGTKRDERRRIQEEFCTNAEVKVLLATDAAGEGVNLQQANLLINYDLPWNPNRIEQRFGRIHRIGQTKPCYMWNMVAGDTREGQVFDTLFKKLEKEREALDGRVFDILGQAFEEKSLKELLLKAIREENSPENKLYMTQQINQKLDSKRLKEIMAQNCLVDQVMTTDALYKIKDEMDKAEARKLQPCFVRSFFHDALQAVGGDLRSRTDHRYKIKNVPACIRNNTHFVTYSKTPILKSYDYICFDRQYITIPGSSTMATYINPEHPLMRSVIDYTYEKYKSILNLGTVLIDKADLGVTPSVLCLIDHTIRESVSNQTISQQLKFVRILPDGTTQNAGWAPHLDLDVPDESQQPGIGHLIQTVKRSPWLTDQIESLANTYAVEKLAKEHVDNVKRTRIEKINKIDKSVRKRLNTAIRFYEHRIEQTQAKPFYANQKANIVADQLRVDELANRLKKRTEELDQQREIASCAPKIIGGILVIPQGLINQTTGVGEFSTNPMARSRIEKLAMDTVMEKERSFGFEVLDVSEEKCGWDITSRPPRVENTADDEEVPIPDDRHIEVKGREKSAKTITVTKNEVCYAINQKDKFILAIVLIDGDNVEGPYYVREPFKGELDDGQVSANYEIDYLLSKSVKPEETL